MEAYNSVGIVERYHSPVRRAYQIITTEVSGIDKETALQMAFKAINDSTGPDGLIPTLLVYGAYPRMSEFDILVPIVTQRVIAVRKAMAEINKLRAKRQVSDALNTRNRPNTDVVHTLELNSLVLVWREGNTGQSGSWEGLYRLVSITGEDCILALPHGNTAFRTTSVKPYFTHESEHNQEPHVSQPQAGESQDQNQPQYDEDTIVVQVPEQDSEPNPEPTKRGRGRPRK